MLQQLCRAPLESCFGDRSGARDDVLWQVKLKPHACGEYSMAVVQANCPLEDQAQVYSSSAPGIVFAGVYDGHGGPHTSKFISHCLFSFIHEYATEQGGLSTDVMRQAIETTEEEFLKFAKKTRFTDPEVALSGSCCLVGAIADGMLYIANVGDSRAVLGRRVCDGGIFCLPSAVAERLTSDHNVGIEAVRKEVRALHPDDSNIVVHTRGFWRIKGIIQVSRAIGDIYLKRPEFSDLYKKFGSSVPLKTAVISAEPSISVRKLDPDDLFIIFASDGLWEHLSDEVAVEIVHRNPRFGIAKRLIRAAVDEAARKRGMTYEDMSKVDIVMRRLFHDDISVIVLFLDHSLGPRYIGSKDYSHFSYSMTPSELFSYDSCEALDNISS